MQKEICTYKVVQGLYPKMSERTCYYFMARCRRALGIAKGMPLYVDEFKKYYRLVGD